MSTILLVCHGDSIATKMLGTAIPVIQETYEAGTNCSDVKIAEVISFSFVAILAICVMGFLVWKQLVFHANKKEREFNKTKEEEESDRKQKADETNRDRQLEDEKRKQKADLLYKKLVALSDDKKAYLTALEEALK